MIVVQINATCTIGSIGKICCAISETLTQKGIENYILHTQNNCTYPRGIQYAGHAYLKLQALKSRIKGNYGFNSKWATRRLIAELERIRPAIVHLHNLHGHNCHIGMLMEYLRRKQIKVIWTFHDCWTFTSYCPISDMIGCERWLTGCRDCPERRKYSWFVDRSRWLYQRKKEASRDLDLTIVAPSEWLAGKIQQSFFGGYPVNVIHSGIDLQVFKPSESNFRSKYGLDNKKVILGVAFGWVERKGLDVFLELSRRLDDSYQIVVVGTNDQIDQILPDSMISIHRTSDQHELAEIYSAADVYVNPTREEVLGLVNIEALACGTPVVMFNTGGSPECVDESCGVVVPKNDVDELEKAIRHVVEDRPFTEEACVSYASKFDATHVYDAYIERYEA